MKDKIKQNIKKILFYAKLYKINAVLNQCYIIMYHMIPEKPLGIPGEVIKSDFEKHVKHLKANYNIISLDDLVNRINNKDSLKGCVVLTFDDGFRDNYLNAYPILKKYQAPATVFLLTGRIDDGDAPWFMKFRVGFMKTPLKRFSLQIEDTSFDLPLNDFNERGDAGTKVMLKLQSIPGEKRIKYVEEIFKILNIAHVDELKDTMMTWDMVKEMSKNGIDFGAHTINHPVLSNSEDADAENEIKQSKESIENNINKEVFSFAYPFGKKKDYNGSTIQIIKNLGFKCAVTTELGPAKKETNLYQMNRCFQGVVRLHDLYWEPYSLSVGSYMS